MKKLLILGSSKACKEMIAYAKSQGIYTIVTDYFPPEKSSAKLLADEYWMISTGDYDQLEIKCREEQVDGVCSGISTFNIPATAELCKRLDFRPIVHQSHGITQSTNMILRLCAVLVKYL